MVALGGVVALTGITAYKLKHADIVDPLDEDCEVSPKETKGPFPNKTPSDYVRENIIGDRKGIALLITMTILDKKYSCKPLANALVDVWHCDAVGDYSEYTMRSGNLNDTHFLRGRQTSDANGQVSFVSIFPGYYRGRAPHIHVEVLSKGQKSLLATQIAFPDEICDTVYATENYLGTNYISSDSDSLFKDSLDRNMADSVTGNVIDGYTLVKSIVVNS